MSYTKVGTIQAVKRPVIRYGRVSYFEVADIEVHVDLKGLAELLGPAAMRARTGVKKLAARHVVVKAINIRKTTDKSTGNSYKRVLKNKGIAAFEKLLEDRLEQVASIKKVLTRTRKRTQEPEATT